jgi:hypothetical protein
MAGGFTCRRLLEKLNAAETWKGNKRGAAAGVASRDTHQALVHVVKSAVFTVLLWRGHFPCNHSTCPHVISSTCQSRTAFSESFATSVQAGDDEITTSFHCCFSCWHFIGGGLQLVSVLLVVWYCVGATRNYGIPE